MRCIQKCSVCGGRAYCFLYGAIACDACGAFFRRHILKPVVSPSQDLAIRCLTILLAISCWCANTTIYA